MMDDLDRRIREAASGANSRLAEMALDAEEDFYAQGLDSLDHVQILMRIEEAFSVTIAESDYDTCISLARIRAFLLRQGSAEP